MNEGYEIAAVDTETTGIAPDSKIVEIAVIVLDYETLEEKDRWETLINPKQPSGPFHIHRIFNEMLADAPKFCEIKETLAELLDGRIFMGHKPLFDAERLRFEFEQEKASFFPGNMINVAPEMHLEEACALYEIHPEGHYHSAMADIDSTVRLYRAIAEQNGVDDWDGILCQVKLPTKTRLVPQKSAYPRWKSVKKTI